MSNSKASRLMGLVGSVLLVAGLLTAAACGADEGTPEPASTATAAPASTPTPAATTTVVAPPAATEPTSMPGETQALGPGAMVNTGPGKIAFVSTRGGNPEIYVINDDGSNMARLTNHPTEDMHPTWSPDGSKLAFVALRDGNHEIYVIDADGSNMTRLTNSDQHEVAPSWSPDGTRIAYSTRIGEGHWEIYVRDADGSNHQRLTFDLVEDTLPTWSPDGSRIAFTSTRQGHQEIFLMNSDGSGQVPLTDLEPTGVFRRHRGPAWSPDGSRIAFHTRVGEDFAIHTMNIDGTGEARVTLSGFGPTWSPDGSRIFFFSQRDGARDLYVMDSDGANVTRLTEGSGLAPLGGSDWAPGRVSKALLAAPTVTPAIPTPTPTPAAPSLQLIGTALTEKLESPVAGVHVHGNYAFVGSQSITYEAPYEFKTGIRIVDISDPANPALVGRIPLRSFEMFSRVDTGCRPDCPHSHGDAVATRIESPAFEGDVAVVLQGVPDTYSVDEYPMPFGIWDVTDPSDPQFLSPLNLGNHFWADSLGDKPDDTKAVHGNYFYAIYSKGQMTNPRDGANDKDHHLAIVDLSDPRNPVVVGNWQDTKEVRLRGLSVNASGTRVYIIGKFGKELLLYVLDVQDPTNPVELARFVWPLPFAGSFSPGRPVANVDDTLVIFADGSWESGRESRLHILDTSDLSSIREISTVDFDEGPRRWYWAHDLAIKGDLIYSTWQGGGLQVIDVSDPANPVVVGGFLSPSHETRWLSDVAMYGDYAVAVAVWGPGLYIVKSPDIL